MSSNADRSLERAASSIFEELAFLLPIERHGDAQGTGPGDAVVALPFHGAFDGELIVRLSPGIVRAIAANMLGTEESLPAELQLDAAGEVANVICGTLLRDLAGPHEVFRLGSPVPGTADAAKPGLALRACTSLGFEEGEVEVRLYTAAPPGCFEEVT
jgi:hypothetical protein